MTAKDAKRAKKFGSVMSMFTVVFLPDRECQREVVFLRSKRTGGIRRN